MPCIWSGELVVDYLVLPLLGVVACIQYTNKNDAATTTVFLFCMEFDAWKKIALVTEFIMEWLTWCGRGVSGISYQSTFVCVCTPFHCFLMVYVYIF